MAGTGAVRWIVLAAFIALWAGGARAQQTTGKATELLNLMRVDETFRMSFVGTMERVCDLAPAARRDACNVDATLIEYRMEPARLAERLTPFIEQNYAPDEVAALVDFYGSKEGRLVGDLTLLGAYNAMNPRAPKPLPPISASDKATVGAFDRTPAGARHLQLTPQFKAELKREIIAYACELIESRGWSCPAIDSATGTSK